MAVSDASASATSARAQRWGTGALRQALEPLLPGLTIDVVEATASTNSDLLERARLAGAARAGSGGADALPGLLVAEHQRAGRGRLGRSWQSPAGASLTFSLALELAPRDWSGLSVAVGVALAEALQTGGASTTAPRVGLKWPNDLCLLDGTVTGGRKIGGVLIETVAAGADRVAVIGVGINIAAVTAALPADLAGRVGCLREIDPTATAPGTLGRVALPLVRALKAFERDGFAAFGARFEPLDALRDAAVVTSDARSAQGTARGVDDQGGLRVETADGVHVIRGGEVSVRPAGQALPAREAR